MKLICAGACLSLSLLFQAPPGPLASAAEDTVRVEKPDSAGLLESIGEQERGELKTMLMQLGSEEVTGTRQWQRKKIPKLAMLGSTVLPGLGQLYDGRRIKVGIVAGLFTTYMAGAWLHWRDAQAAIAYRGKFPEDASFRVVDFQNRLIEYHKESARDFLWWSGAIWVLGILDAWIDAHLYDIRVYTPESNIKDEQKTAVQGRQQYLTLSIGF